MTLLSGAGTVVLWCMAVVIGVAVVAVAVLHAWDWWYVRTWYRRRK
jgi:hypothetical protein